MTPPAAAAAVARSSGIPGIVVAVAAAAALASCRPSAPHGTRDTATTRPAPARDAAAAAAAAAPVDEPLAVTLHRGACHGTCPVYRVSVRSLADGRAAVRYEGERNVAVAGVATDTMSRAALGRLAAALSAADYFALPARYAYQEPSCPTYTTDSPVVTTTVRRAGRDHAVEHDYGCRDAPATLTAFERAIDDAAGTERWVGRP